MKELYILATEEAQPASLAAVKETLASEEVQFIDKPGLFFCVKTEDLEIDVRFEELSQPLGWTPDLLNGTEESHQTVRKARSLYKISFAPGQPQPSVAVFEALWCARALMEHLPAVLLDVSAYKLHAPDDVVEITELDFDIRDHISLHAVQAGDGEHGLWVHSHGMEKFACPDVEAFNLAEDDLLPAEAFFHQLCTDLAFGQGPELRALVGTGEGGTFRLLPSDESRSGLMGLSLDTFEGHEGVFLTAVSAEGRHTLADVLKPYRERFLKEPEEATSALLSQARELLPSFKARYLRKGLMEPIIFLVRATFETHPDKEAVDEDLWVEVVQWNEEGLLGKMTDGSAHTTEWRKGAHVELEDTQINAIAISRDGRPLPPDEMRHLLNAERPM